MSKNTKNTKSNGSTEKQEPAYAAKQNAKARKPINWGIKITIVTFILSIFFSFLSEITSSRSNITVAMLLLVFLILLSIITDCIGVAATSCDLPPLLSMAARKVPGSKTAIKLIKNAEKVSNICSDVIGDICGIVSGACALAIALKLLQNNESKSTALLVNILFSSVVAALTVGGKAFLKDFAVKNSKEVIIFVSRLLSAVFKEK